MTITIYVKDSPAKYKKLFGNRETRKKRKIDRYFFGLISFVGIASVIFAVWPYLIWQINTIPKLTGKIKEVPVPQGKVLSAKAVLSEKVQVVKDPDGFSYFTTNYKPESERPEEFFLSIPKLKIEEAKVKVDSLNFSSNLSHFPGSALPGEVGNSFITGHSVLPQFYDPKNYKTIFSKLTDLEVGDEIITEVEGKKLRYLVQYSRIVDPQDTSVLAPISANGKNLTLMTCVPPGTSIKRLIVVASLI